MRCCPWRDPDIYTRTCTRSACVILSLARLSLSLTELFASLRACARALTHRMWAVANGFKSAGITSFNGYQVQGGASWQNAWFGKLPECKVLVLMLSKSYFKSDACIKELQKACEIDKPIIPIYLEEVDTAGHFLGETNDQIPTANVIRLHISGNRVPPPDQGFFQGNGAADFRRNMSTLIDVVRSQHLTQSRI